MFSQPNGQRAVAYRKFVFYKCLVGCVRAYELLAMSFTVEAIYEDGVLKSGQPVAFREHEKV